MKTQKYSRIVWIDNLKWIGIVLIVLWHCYFPTWSVLVQYLFSFHVPLFFFISGLLFDDQKHSNIIKFFKNRFKRLIIPYFIFNIIMYLFLKIFDKSEIWIWSFFQRTLYGNYIWPDQWLSIINVPTWFLLTLFLVWLYYFLLNKLVKSRLIKVIIIIILSILIFIESKFVNFRLPWGAEVWLMGLFFYSLAHIFRREINNTVEKINLWYILLVPFLIFTNLLLLNDTNMSTNEYGNYFLFMINSFLGIYVFVIFSKVLWKNSITTFLGKNTLIILWMEWIKTAIIKYIIVFSMWYLVYEKWYIQGILQWFFTLLSIIFLIFLIEYYRLYISKNKNF